MLKRSKPGTPSKPLCTNCGSRYHYKTFCREVPKKPPEDRVLSIEEEARSLDKWGLPKRRKPKKRYYINPFGSTTKKWVATRQNWINTRPGPWNCHYCGRLLTAETLTLDHLIPKSRAPELRHDFNNLVPCCWPCNGLKGSVAHDEYPHVCH